MALTATAQSALPPTPSWDETIVPTLRKRLENESRMLTKRISAVSITSDDDFDFASNSQYYHRTPASSHTHSHSSQSKPPSTNSRFVPSAHERAQAASPTSSGTKPSGIPRPSLQTSRPSISDSRERSTTPTGGNGSVISTDSRRSRSKGPAQATAPSQQPTTARTRTLSQPKLLDRAAALEQPKKAPTRIPIPRNRAGSASSPNQSPLLQSNASMSRSDSRMNGSVNGINGNGYANGNYALEPEDLKSVTLDERDYEARSAAQPRYGNTSASAAAMQRVKTMDDDYPPRPSTDSEERPFEHWYRGEVARNGGVGELRVGRHLEMLEIANYGHKVRAAEARAGKRSSMGRRRAESIGLAGGSGMGTVGSRQSFYMEADDSRVERVLDEVPLTDVESDTGSILDDYISVHPRSASALGFGEERERERFEDERQRSETPTGMGAGAGAGQPRERKVSRAGGGDLPTSRIPTPTMMNRKMSDPPARTPTPTSKANLTVNTAAAAHGLPSPRTPRSGNTTAKSPSSSQLPSTSTPITKRRAKSPGDTLVSPANKKTKTAGGKHTQPPVTPMRGRDNGRGRRDSDDRRSIAEYPDPGDGDLSNAIPTWSQPVPAKGNWDEVVLPAVARKKGMDEHYTRVDGTPQPKKKSMEHQPAPGTFGFDYSKYSSRQPRLSGTDGFGRRTEEENSDDIEMDEQHEHSYQEESYPEDESPQPPPEDQQQGPPSPKPKPPIQRRETGDRIRRQVQSPPSPAPFSHYINAGNSNGEGEGEAADVAQYAAQMEMDERGKEGRGRQDVEEEKGAGCCKCVVM